MRSFPLVVAGLLGSSLTLGCAGAQWPEVTDTRSFGAGGGPAIRRVRDLGNIAIPREGALAGDADGVASPGELLLIEGSGFGRQPAVTIGGRPAETVARTLGGGVVVQVPIAIRAGVAKIELQVGDEHAEANFPIRRLALLVHEGRVHVAAVSRQGAQAISELAIEGARAVRIAADGSTAYVLTPRRLYVLALGAAAAPKVVATRDLAVEARALLVAERAPLLVVVGDTAIQSFELRNPALPAPYEAQPLPAEVAGFTRSDMTADGRRIALLLPDGNRVALVDVSRAKEAPRTLAELSVLPEARAPLVVDLRFASDGETLWVLSGDNLASTAIGTQPTRIIGVRVAAGQGGDGGSEAQLALWRAVPVEDAYRPLRLLVTRTPPPASGATIRLAPEKATLFFTAAAKELWSGTIAADVASQFDGRKPGAIDRPQLDNTAVETSGHFVTTELLLGPLDSAVDVFAAAAGRVGPAGREFGVATSGPVSGGELPRVDFLRLGVAAESDFVAPFALGDLRLQP